MVIIQETLLHTARHLTSFCYEEGKVKIIEAGQTKGNALEKDIVRMTKRIEELEDQIGKDKVEKLSLTVSLCV